LAFTPITLVGLIERPDGSVAEGTFTVTLSEPMINGTTIIEPTPLTGKLTAGGPVNSAGQPFVIEAVDDTGTEPTTAYYTFVLQLDNAPIDPFRAVISHLAPGGQVNLASLIPPLS